MLSLFLVCLLFPITIVVSSTYQCNSTNNCNFGICGIDDNCNGNIYICGDSVQLCKLQCHLCHNVTIYSSAVNTDIVCKSNHACTGLSVFMDSITSESVVLSCQTSQSCLDVYVQCNSSNIDECYCTPNDMCNSNQVVMNTNLPNRTIFTMYQTTYTTMNPTAITSNSISQTQTTNTTNTTNHVIMYTDYYSSSSSSTTAHINGISDEHNKDSQVHGSIIALIVIGILILLSVWTLFVWYYYKNKILKRAVTDNEGIGVANANELNEYGNNINGPKYYHVSNASVSNLSNISANLSLQISETFADAGSVGLPCFSPGEQIVPEAQINGFEFDGEAMYTIVEKDLEGNITVGAGLPSPYYDDDDDDIEEDNDNDNVIDNDLDGDLNLDICDNIPIPTSMSPSKSFDDTMLYGPGPAFNTAK